jgi:hypothetical protein
MLIWFMPCIYSLAAKYSLSDALLSWNVGKWNNWTNCNYRETKCRDSQRYDRIVAWDWERHLEAALAPCTNARFGFAQQVILYLMWIAETIKIMKLHNVMI